MIVMKQMNELFGMLEYEESRILGLLAYGTVFMPRNRRCRGCIVFRLCVRVYVITYVHDPVRLRL